MLFQFALDIWISWWRWNVGEHGYAFRSFTMVLLYLALCMLSLFFFQLNDRAKVDTSIDGHHDVCQSLTFSLIEISLLKSQAGIFLSFSFFVCFNAVRTDLRGVKTAL